VSSSLLNDLAREREMVRYRIESLIGIRHNASLTGMYKTGKTGLACDLATALADGRPFLGSLAVEMPQGRIGFWNGEMDRDDFLHPSDRHPESQQDRDAAPSRIPRAAYH
jgi:RecA-family ATPase